MSIPKKSHTVCMEDSGIRLDRWFKRHYPHLPPGVVQRMIRTKEIRIDSKRAEPNQRLEEGQQITIPEMLTIPKDPLEIDKGRQKKSEALIQKTVETLRNAILYQDEKIMVFNKPAGLASQGGKGIQVSVDDVAAELWKGKEGERLHLVHRLDKDTSGVLIMAKGAAQAANLTAQFRERDVHKEYMALVVGLPSPQQGSIKLKLRKEKSGNQEKVAVDNESGQYAVTEYRVLDHAAKKVALVSLLPVTGRTHQLRVHIAAIGCPILGDGKYGGKRAFIRGCSQQMHLHAHAITIDDFNGKPLVLEAPLPLHIRESMEILGLNGKDG